MRLESLRGVSPLGAWRYVSWRPPHLAGLVDHVWSFTGPSTHLRKRIFPNGCVELVVNFGDPYRLVDPDGNRLLPSTWIGGPQDESMLLEQPAYQDCLGVRLRPAGAYAVLARPLGELKGLSIDLADVIGAAASELSGRCREAPSLARRFRCVADWLIARMVRARAMDAAVAWTVDELVRSGGSIAIATLRAETGLSKARLASTFRDQVGLTPKLFARVVRFHRALGLLQHAGAASRITDLALDASFYDQAHLNAEFRSLGGITPRAFLARRHPVGDGTTAAEGPPAA